MHKHFRQTFSYGGATIEYRSFDLPSVKLGFDDEKRASGAVRLNSVTIDGEKMEYTDRFGVSFATLLAQSPTIFNLFSVDEVITRALTLKKVHGVAVIAIDRTGGKTKALAVSPESKRFFALPHLEDYMKQLGASGSLSPYAGKGEFKITYDLSKVHRPFSMHTLDFSPNMTLRVSVDSWGKPQAWLSLALSSRGLVLRAQSDAFRSSANIGEDSGKYVSALSRFTRSFSNEEGFGVLAARIDAAHKASASLAEFLAFDKAVLASEVSERAMTKMTDLAYKEAERFGLSSLAMVSKKRLVRVPSVLSVADLLMMGAEIASKEAVGSVDKIYEWMGSVLADDSGFDLEGTLEEGTVTSPSYLEDDDALHALQPEAATPPAPLEREGSRLLHGVPSPDSASEVATEEPAEEPRAPRPTVRMV